VTVPEVLTSVMAVLPSWMELDAATIAPFPNAVELDRLFTEAFELAPTKVLFEPIVLSLPELYPKAELLVPLDVLKSELYPIDVFKYPIVFEYKDE
jgi:hypothetical protein